MAGLAFGNIGGSSTDLNPIDCGTITGQTNELLLSEGETLEINNKVKITGKTNGEAKIGDEGVVLKPGEEITINSGEADYHITGLSPAQGGTTQVLVKASCSIPQ